MVFHKIRSLSMTELFVREIKRMILMGELKIGDRLPPERELAQKMGLKLTVVNSGIAQLQQMGFLKAAPRQAVFVEDYLTNGNIRTMMEMIDFTDHVIDEDLLELMIHIRATLEQFIFRKMKMTFRSFATVSITRRPNTAAIPSSPCSSRPSGTVISILSVTASTTESSAANGCAPMKNP